MPPATPSVMDPVAEIFVAPASERVPSITLTVPAATVPPFDSISAPAVGVVVAQLTGVAGGTTAIVPRVIAPPMA